MRDVIWLILVCWLSSVQSLWATAYTWTRGTSTAWSTATNWTPNGVPGSIDNVTIGSATWVPLLDANRSVLTFTINNGSLNLGGFTLTVNGDTYLSQGTLVNGNLVVTAGAFKTGGSYNTFHWGPVLENVNLTVTASVIYLFKATITGAVSLTKSGTTNDGYQSCWNIFNGPVSITNAASTSLTFGGSGYPDVFNGELSLANTGSSYICMAYNSLGNQFNGNVILHSTGGEGIYLGFLSGSSCQLADGKQLMVGNLGFSSGTLQLKQFTQLGATPQNLTLTGSSSLRIAIGATFNGLVDFKAPQLYLDGATFNGVTYLEKTGVGRNISAGGNTFNSVTTIANSGNEYLYLAYLTRDIFNTDVIFSNSGSAAIYPANRSSDNLFNGNIVLNCTNGVGIGIGEDIGTWQLAEGKTVRVGSVGFNAGRILLKGGIQRGAAPQSFDLLTAYIYIANMTFNSPVTYKAPAIYIQGSSFYQTAVFEQFGSADVNNCGGNTFHAPSSFTLSGSSRWEMGSFGKDIFNSDLTLTNTGTSGDGFLMSNRAEGNVYNGNVMVNITNNSSVMFGYNGGTSTLVVDKIIAVGPVGVTAGQLDLRAFKQLGDTPQTLTFTGNAALRVGYGSEFNGSVNFKASILALNGCTYNNSATLEKTGPYTGCIGGNFFNGNTHIINSSASQYIVPEINADIYSGDVTFTNSGSGTFYVGNGANATSNSQFNGNVFLNSTNGGGIIFNFNNNSINSSSILAEGKTISTGNLGFVAGELKLCRFTQLGTTPQNLTLTGSASLRITGGTTFNGAVDFKVPQLYLDGATYNAPATFTKTAAGINNCQGGNVFKKRLELINPSNGTMNMATGKDDLVNPDNN